MINLFLFPDSAGFYMFLKFFFGEGIMNLQYYPIVIQLFILQYISMGYKLGNTHKRSLFDCQ